MKFKILLILTTLSTCMFASDAKMDELLWKSAYNGDYSTVFKLVLLRQSDDINDELCVVLL